MALKPIQVSELNRYLARVLETDPLLSIAAVRGEISAPRKAASGHLYFTLKDETSKIGCMIFRDDLAAFPLEPQDGMAVTVRGRIQVYQASGTYTLIVKSMEAEGQGSLQAAFLKLKERLEKEGLFDPAHKKPVPAFPRHVGVITSGTGAAVRDIMKNLQARNSLVDITILPVLVQGAMASTEISRAIEYANREHPDLDVLIVGRGGGSIEDLWAFNEEKTARAIFQSRIPVISAVGHEIDFTISDFVADVRAETPTKAAVIAVPDIAAIREELERSRNQLRWQMEGSIQSSGHAAQNQLLVMKTRMLRRLDQAAERLEHARLSLSSNHPGRILNRGYAMLQDDDGKVISDVNRLAVDGEYRLTLKNGEAAVRVVSTRSERGTENG